MEKPYLSFIPVNFCQRRCLILPDEELTPVAPTNRGNEAHESPAGNLEKDVRSLNHGKKNHLVFVSRAHYK